MVAITLLPLLDRGRVKLARWIAVLVALTGIASAHWASLYSELRPQRVNFTYVVDADENRANVLAWSPNPLPPRWPPRCRSREGPTPLPWEQREPPLVAAADVIQREATTLDTASTSGTTRTLRLHPVAETNAVTLVLPAQAQIDAIRIDGQPVTTEIARARRLSRAVVRCAGQREITIEIDTKSPDRIDGYLLDTAFRLPDGSKPLADARGPLAAPGGHLGDRWIVLRRVKI